MPSVATDMPPQLVWEGGKEILACDAKGLRSWMHVKAAESQSSMQCHASTRRVTHQTSVNQKHVTFGSVLPSLHMQSKLGQQQMLCFQRRRTNCLLAYAMPCCEEGQRAVPSVATDMPPSLASCALQLSAGPSIVTWREYLQTSKKNMLHMYAAKLCNAMLFLKKATERRSASLTMLRYAGAA